ncbi:hypothetical protein P152DRAFT_11852 [Eremomyces bilateralis CBS 781.70]|uniref:Telomere repeat-binding factor dimerisation domain-containing protein n=1 Tax=Eremomyces bilateralis CBS 781.70 TaxID=1392243 RepID=A0A6G1GH78_9PEZI|nr:uncharacterized protein P152DRAFT_11852 [Eremomyces bilateralis CBS 781.70]KAF1817220.1 hypothetical protein P152DRAFT_11852 [Eremomyces bilateralis CBS 781.70]
MRRRADSHPQLLRWQSSPTNLSTDVYASPPALLRFDAGTQGQPQYQPEPIYEEYGHAEQSQAGTGRRIARPATAAQLQTQAMSLQVGVRGGSMRGGLMHEGHGHHHGFREHPPHSTGMDAAASGVGVGGGLSMSNPLPNVLGLSALSSLNSLNAMALGAVDHRLGGGVEPMDGRGAARGESFLERLSRVSSPSLSGSSSSSNSPNPPAAANIPNARAANSNTTTGTGSLNINGNLLASASINACSAPPATPTNRLAHSHSCSHPSLPHAHVPHQSTPSTSAQSAAHGQGQTQSQALAPAPNQGAAQPGAHALASQERRHSSLLHRNIYPTTPSSSFSPSLSSQNAPSAMRKKRPLEDAEYGPGPDSQRLKLDPSSLHHNPVLQPTNPQRQRPLPLSTSPISASPLTHHVRYESGPTYASAAPSAYPYGDPSHDLKFPSASDFHVESRYHGQSSGSAHHANGPHGAAPPAHPAQHPTPQPQQPYFQVPQTPDSTTLDAQARMAHGIAYSSNAHLYSALPNVNVDVNAATFGGYLPQSAGTDLSVSDVYSQPLVDASAVSEDSQSSWDYYSLDASIHLKLQSLPILDNLATQILGTFANSTFPEVISLISEPESGRGQAYTTLCALFDQNRKLYTRDQPFLDARALHLDQQPDADKTIRKANFASFILSIFGRHDIPFSQLNESFLEIVVPPGQYLRRWQSTLLLELKTQGYIATALSHGALAPERDEETLEEYFPRTMQGIILSRRNRSGIAASASNTTTSKRLAPTEEDLIRRLNQRRQKVLEVQDGVDGINMLSHNHDWTAFLKLAARTVAKFLAFSDATDWSQRPKTPDLDDDSDVVDEDSPSAPNHVTRATLAAHAAIHGQRHPSEGVASSSLYPSHLYRNYADLPSSSASGGSLPSTLNSSSFPPTFSHAHALGLPSDTTPSQPPAMPTSLLYTRARSQTTTKAPPRSSRPGLPSQRRPWALEEEHALMDGLDRVKGPHWSQILALYGAGGSISEVLKERNQVQLKDKARNLKLFFLKSGIEVPVYLQGVTGELLVGNLGGGSPSWRPWDGQCEICGPLFLSF